MSLSALVTTAKLLAADPPGVPNPSPAALPDKVNKAFDSLIGMMLTAAGAVAVVCLVAAGIMLMFGETGHGSGGAKFVKIFGGLGIALGAGSLVGLIWAA